MLSIIGRIKIQIMKWVDGLSACFSHVTMVREAMTSAELSSDLQHHKVQNSEPLQEHAGIYRRFFLPVYLNRNMWIITACFIVSPPDVTMEAESHDLLLCNERLPSSPGGPSSDSYIEYGT